MPLTLWKYTMREVQRRPGRSLLTLAGIVIGVATVVAITATTRATRRSYRAMFDEIGGKSALEVTTPGQGGFDPRPVREALAKVEGVAASVGVIQTRAGLVRSGVITPVLVLGIDPEQDRAVRTWELAKGQALDDADGVLLEAGFASQLGIGLGDKVTLGAETGLTSLPVVGLLHARGPALYNGGALVVMRLPSAQRLFSLPGMVNSVQIVLKPGADAERVREAAIRQLADTVQVQIPLARSALAQGSLVSTEQALSGLSVVSLVGGGLVILNSFLMNLGERRRQLAILRALGTTRRQVTGLLLREALLLGVAGTVLGIGLGALLARGLVTMQESVLGTKLPPLDFGVEPFVMALVFGPGLSLVATIVPAWRAGRRSPLEAMRPRRSTPEAGESRLHWPRYLGVFGILVCAFFLTGSVRGWWGIEINTILLAPVMMLFLIGSVLALPAILTPLLWVVSRLLLPVFGTEGALAFRQLERQHMRTGLTVGVLFIGIIVTIGFGSALLGNIHDIDRWYRRTIPADFLIRGSMPDPGTVWASPMPRAVRDELARLDGVDEYVGRINFITVTVQGKPALLLARDYPRGRALPLALVEGDESEVRAGLENGAVVLGTALAHRTGLKRGDELELKTKHGDRKLRVAGVAKEYTVGGLAFYASWDSANGLFDLSGINAFEVHVKPGEEAAAARSVGDYCERRGLLVQSNAQLREYIDTLVGSVEGFLWVLIALVFVVAALGIVNTLTMNVHEQTRELGVLRAIGLKRGQVRKLVVAQAAALGLLSVLPGVLAGVGLAWLMNAATYPFSGHVVAFEIRLGFVAACGGIALAIAVLASLLPARRAARLHIIEALHYE